MFKYPIVCEGRSPEEIQKMEDENALPHGWEKMLYDEFLIERRKLMAAKIKKAFEILKSNAKWTALTRVALLTEDDRTG